MGFLVAREAAREVLLEGFLHPKNKDPLPFQREIARRQKISEEKLEKSGKEISFLDRGFFDMIAYCYHFGIQDLPEETNINAHYDGVFVLEMLPKFEDDGVRIEDGMNETMEIYRLILEEYQKRSIPLIFVPVMPIRERTEFIVAKAASM